MQTEINPVYYDFLDSQIPTQIYFGGSSSGKSYFLSQRAVLDVLEGRNYLILRKVQRDCRKSVWNETVKRIKEIGLWDMVSTNKTELTITFPNGRQILFGGLDDRERIKSITPEEGVITDIWLEEATEFDEEDYKQITKRLRGDTKKVKRITLSFNPIIKQHWIYKKFFDNWQDDKNYYEDERLSILKTTYRDNIFLTDDDIERLESETDPYYRDVYVNGNWGVLGDVIFTNWEVRNFDVEQLDQPIHGLDFGFSVDPAAAYEGYYDKANNTIFIYDEIYETKMSDRELASRVKEKIGRELIKCDSAEPKSIELLKSYGVNAVGAKKGPGSIETSYRWLQSQRIILHPRCVNLKRELQTHQWKKDRYGNSIAKPQDKDNHLIDALRYGTEDYWQAKQGWGF